MSRAEELVIELDGKIAYADTVGNMKDKHELCEIRALIKSYIDEKRSKEN